MILSLKSDIFFHKKNEHTFQNLDMLQTDTNNERSFMYDVISVSAFVNLQKFTNASVCAKVRCFAIISIIDYTNHVD